MNQIDSSQKAAETIRNMCFCVIDLETTGGNHKSDKIIEIGLVKIEKLKITSTKSLLINPEIPIPDFIQKLTSITVNDVSSSPTIEEVIDEILAFMGDSILIAHNTSFDIPFFNSVLTRLNKTEITNPTLCTNLMTKYLIPNLMNSNLNYMSKIFGIDHKKAHRALDDAYATAELFLKYLSIFLNKQISKINHLYYPKNKYELDRRDIRNDAFEAESFEESIANIKTPYVITLKGDNGIILFSLPCSGSENELSFIIENIKKYPWIMATIRLYGTFTEAIIYFNGFYNKVAGETRSSIISFLENEYSSVLSKYDYNETSNDDEFIIINHLVPEQYIIYPIKSLHPGSALVFRYPNHKKKLLQYIQSKSNRIKKNKIKKVFFHKSLNNFLQRYIWNSPAHYILNRKTIANDQSIFFEQLDAFLEKNPNKCQYPKEYL